MKLLYLVRHGETRANADAIFRGRIDYGLTARGMEESIRLRKTIEALEPDTAFSSPLKRAIQTAELSLRGSCEIIRDERINNLDLGDWAGQPLKTIQTKYPNEWSLWHDNPEAVSFPNGESMGDLKDRIKGFLSFIKDHTSESIVIFSHRSVIKTMLGVALGMEEYFWKFRIEHSAVSVLEFNDKTGFILTALNIRP